MTPKKLTRREKQRMHAENVQDTFVAHSMLSELRYTRLMLGLFVASVGFVFYINSVSNEYVLDDYPAIMENFVTKEGVSSIPTILHTPYRYGYWNNNDKLYRPLSLVMYAIEWEFFPQNPHVNHLVNVLLYAFTGWLLFMLLYKVMNFNINIPEKTKLLLPLISSVLYTAHPIHTEVVANIKSRDEILCFLSFLGSAWFLFDYLTAGKKSKLIYSLLCFLLALLSKESAVTFLLLLPLMMFFFTPLTNKRIVTLIIPFAIVTIVYLIVRHNILQGVKFDEPISSINNTLAAAPDAFSRIATAVMILGKYLWLLLLPHPLSYDYSFNSVPVTSWADYRALLALAIYSSALVYALIRFGKKDVISFGIFFYLIPLSLVSNIFILIESTMAERFIFIPSYGFCLIASVLLIKITRAKESVSFSSLISGNKLLLAIMIVVLMGYGAKTITRNADWKNNLTLYSNDIPVASKSARARYLLGNELIKFQLEKETDKTKKEEIFSRGVKELEESIKIYPPYADAFGQLGVAYYKMANYALADKQQELALKHFADAEKHLVEALKINPNAPEANSNLGSVVFMKGEKQRSIDLFLKAIQYNPRYADAYRNAGSAYGELQQYDKAIEYFNKTLVYDPNNAQVYYYIGLTYQFMGQAGKAEPYFAKAYQMNPSLRK